MSGGNSSLQAAASGRGGGGPPPGQGRGNYQPQGRGGYHQNMGGRGVPNRPAPTTQTAAAMQNMASMGPGAVPGSAGPLPPNVASSLPPAAMMGGYPQQYGVHPQYQMHPQGMMMATGPQGQPMMYRGPPPQYRGMPPPQYQGQPPQYSQGARHYPMNPNAMGAMNRSAPPSSLGAAAARGAPTPRASKALVITDKHGNPIDLSKGKGSSSSGKATPASDSPVTTSEGGKTAAQDGEGGLDSATAKMSTLQVASKSTEAGDALRRAAMEAIANGGAKKAAEKKAKEEAERLAAEKKIAEEKAAKEEAARIEREKIEREERERLAEAEARARKEA